MFFAVCLGQKHLSLLSKDKHNSKLFLTAPYTWFNDIQTLELLKTLLVGFSYIGSLLQSGCMDFPCLDASSVL